MKKVLTIIAGAAFMASTPVAAKPIYLTCPLTPLTAELAVSEDLQIVSYRFSTAPRSFRIEAMFSATTIRWRDGVSLFILNRKTLELTLSDQTVGNLKGICTIDQVSPTKI